ncbi:MAG: alcohol dehydrogenase catalytic domain-containing protein [Planctomycetota bacterium]
MRACVLVDVGRLELLDVPDPTPGPRDVLLSTSAVGLCGTDFHIFGGEMNFNLDERGQPIALRDAPQILGHEITGVVQEVGSEVGGLAVGDRVVLDQGLSCVSAARDLCEYCASGDSHQCEGYIEHGITGLEGGFAEYVATPGVNAVKIESDLDAARAAMTEPLGCILHSSDFAQRANTRYRIGDADPARKVRTALVCGAGPAGLLWIQVLRSVLGFDGTLLVAEIDDTKREAARALGAEPIDPRATDLTEAVRERTSGRMVEYLVEATGNGPIFAQLPALIRKQATFVMYGVGHGGASLELMNQVQWKEPSLVLSVGASGGFDDDGRPTIYRRALHLIEDGKVDVASIASHRYEGLERIPEAFGGDHAQPGYVKGVALFG